MSGSWPNRSETPTPLKKPTSTVRERKVRQKSQPQDARQKQEARRQQGGCAGERQPMRRERLGQVLQAGKEDGSRGRVGTDHQMTRGAEQREGEDRQQDGVQPVTTGVPAIFV